MSERPLSLSDISNQPVGSPLPSEPHPVASPAPEAPSNSSGLPPHNGNEGTVRRRRRWEKPLACVAIVGATASFLTWEAHNALDKKHNHEKLIAQANVEERKLMAGYQNNRLNTAGAIMVLHAGAQLRTTPVAIDSRWKGWAPGNLVEEIPKGQEVVAVAGAWNVDDKGTWVALKFGEPTTPRKGAKDRSPTAIADDYVWFNFGKEKDELNAAGEPKVTVYPFDPKKSHLTDTATMDGAGNITDVTVDRPAAFGLKYRGHEVEEILNIFNGTTPLLKPSPGGGK